MVDGGASRYHGFRILHLLVPGLAGGLETVVRLLARAQREAGAEPVIGAVLESDPDAHPYIAELRADGCRVVPIRVGSRAYVSEWLALWRLCRAERAHVVHTHGARADVIGGLAARAAGFPWVTTLHGFTGGDTRNRFYERLQVRAGRRADAVVAVSEQLGRLLRERGIPADRLKVVRNAWVSSTPPLEREAARARLELAGDRPVFGWVGRLSREKGLDLLLEALSTIRPPRPLVAVVGDGSERELLTALVARLGLEQDVRWCGALSQASVLFRAFDGYVLSSRTEGTPMVLFEAMEAGVPIVAAAVGGVPDVLTHDTAWLVAPNDPAALARAMTEVLSDPSEASKRAGRARQRLHRDFAVGPWVERHFALYRAAASAGRPE